MLLTVVSSLLYTRERRLMPVFPKGLIKIWNVWQLPLMVLMSLFLQTVLILFGNRRKYKTSNFLRFILWLTYMSADWVATVALGILSNDSKSDKGEDKSGDPNFVIMASWAPFLLVHLGGPDTITAYSLEDNELWKRHLLGLGVQTSVAIYVFFRSWNGCLLNFLTIPVFFAGVIKFGERTWVLMSGSSEHFRESILPSPDPGPNYAKFMDDYISKIAEGYKVSLGKLIDTDSTVGHSQGAIINDRIPDGLSLHHGFNFFQVFKRLFADLILSFQDRESSRSVFLQDIGGWETAFKVIEIELGFMYDRLYTKAILTYSRLGFVLKTVSFSCTLLAFITFCHLLIDCKPENCKYKKVDTGISFCLFAGAIALEIYAIIVLISSDRAMLWLTKKKNWGIDLLYKCISVFQTCFKLSNTRRWSNRVSQFNFISFSLKDERVMCIGMQKRLHIYKLFENYYYMHTEAVSGDLKKLIYEQLVEKSLLAVDFEKCKEFCAYRGDQVLRNWKCLDPEINGSVKVEFDQSILLWHIATDLCYSDEDSSTLNPVTQKTRQTTKLLSNYMMYLLVMRPSMLPSGIGQIRVQDTRAEAIEFFEERKNLRSVEQACKRLLQVHTDIKPSTVKGDRSKSVLFDACRLAKSLQGLETKYNWSKEEKWGMMSHVWVEMLSHAASQCRGLQHAKQLMKGGELLTHAWLLMAHLGITEQFQISQGHARAKLLET